MASDLPDESLREWAIGVVRADARGIGELITVFVVVVVGLAAGADILGWRAVEFAVLVLLLTEYIRGGGS